MKIAVLQAGRSPQSLQDSHGDYDTMCKHLLGYSQIQVKTYAVLDDHFPDAVVDYDLYIITGSPCGVYDGFPWIAKLEAFIQQAYAGHILMIGLCFGHQVMAQALGGTVVKSEKGYGIGVMDYTLMHPRDTHQDISLCAWHQDQVITPPHGAELILTSEFCPNAGFIYGQQAISFQPHPEFSKAFVKDLIAVRRGETISDQLADRATASLMKETDTPHIQTLLRDFLSG